MKLTPKDCDTEREIARYAFRLRMCAAEEKSSVTTKMPEITMTPQIWNKNWL